MPDTVLFVNLGIGGVFLTVLFLGLRSGAIWTGKSVDKLMAEKELRLKEKDTYIAKIEQINEKLDQRNDLLASKMDQVLEVSRAHGMLEALPPKLGERVVS